MNYLLYPYSDSLSSIVDNIGYYKKDIVISRLIAPIAWKGSIKSNKNVSFDFYEFLDDVDAVIFADALVIRQSKQMYADVIRKINEAMNKKKNIICCIDLKNEDLDFFTKLAKEKKIRFDFYKKNNIVPKGSFNKLDTVVIGIGGLLQNVDVLPVFMNIVFRYRRLGYRVTAVVDDPNVAICGFVPFPRYIISEEGSNIMTVNKLNAFYDILQYTHQPDIIITQIPDGLVIYQDYCTEGFGINAFMLSQAVSIDYFIMTAPTGELTAEAFNGMSTMLKYRFGFRLGAVGIVDKAIDYSEVFMKREIIFDKIDSEEVSKYINTLCDSNENEIMFFDVNDSAFYDKLVDKSIDTLST